MSSHTSSHRVPSSRPGGLRWLAVPAVLAGLAGGLWFFGGVVAPGYKTSIAFGLGWFVVAGLVIGQLAKRVPPLKVPMRATFLTASAVAAVGFYWTSIRDDTVNEVVATGVAASQIAQSPATPAPSPASTAPTPVPAPTNVELARGAFSARAHSGSGTAAIVELAEGGRRLTLTNFETDNGPDLFVYLTTGSVDGSVDDFVDLGRLKGNVGNQQYTVPESVDLSKYTTVVIWCRAFSVNFAEATLRAS